MVDTEQLLCRGKASTCILMVQQARTIRDKRCMGVTPTHLIGVSFVDFGIIKRFDSSYLLHGREFNSPTPKFCIPPIFFSHIINRV